MDILDQLKNFSCTSCGTVYQGLDPIVFRDMVMCRRCKARADFRTMRYQISLDSSAQDAVQKLIDRVRKGEAFLFSGHFGNRLSLYRVQFFPRKFGESITVLNGVFTGKTEKREFSFPTLFDMDHVLGRDKLHLFNYGHLKASRRVLREMDYLFEEVIVGLEELLADKVSEINLFSFLGEE